MDAKTEEAFKTVGELMLARREGMRLGGGEARPTQAQLAEHLRARGIDCSQSTICHWETGTRIPKQVTQFALVGVLLQEDDPERILQILRDSVVAEAKRPGGVKARNKN